jgi:hypothetical protein
VGAAPPPREMAIGDNGCLATARTRSLDRVTIAADSFGQQRTVPDNRVQVRHSKVLSTEAASWLWGRGRTETNHPDWPLPEPHRSKVG